jgi:N-acyl-D-aspartate/D-glutamate deacylase
MADLVIRGAAVIDGTGRARVTGDVALDGTPRRADIATRSSPGSRC